MTLSASQSTSSRGRWLTLVAALLGWMFDGLEMGLFPLVARPALGELLGSTEDSVIGHWIAIITAVFLVGAATGGVLFGWLGDRIGRVRAMALSVLTYAIFSGLCGLAGSAWQVAAFRFVASLGMGGEWSLGVALVMEVWPDRSRAWLAGVIGAAANFGYMVIALVALALSGIKDLSSSLGSLGIGPETSLWLGSNSGWRLLMLFGSAPALLTFLIRLFVPESGRWLNEQKKGATSHWQARDLLGVLIGASAACGMIALWNADVLPLAIRLVGSALLIAVITCGYLFPIVRYIGRADAAEAAAAHNVSAGIGPSPSLAILVQPTHQRAIIRRLLLAAALSGVALLGTWGSTQWAPTYADKMSGDQRKAEAGTDAPRPLGGWSDPTARPYTQTATAFGAVLGCVAAALMGEWLGRRITYAILCVGSMGAIVGLYQFNTEYGSIYLCWAFLAGTITAAFYGWLPLYLPELFRTNIRATAQGFGFNFGRILAAIGVLQLPVVMKQFHVGWQGACTAMSLIYIVGLGLIWLAPETKGKPLPA